MDKLEQLRKKLSNDLFLMSQQKRALEVFGDEVKIEKLEFVINYTKALIEFIDKPTR